MSMLAAAAPLTRLTGIHMGSFVRAACRRERPAARLFAPRRRARAVGRDRRRASPARAPKAGKQRLDELTIARYPEFSRTVVQSWIAQGKVLRWTGNRSRRLAPR